MLNYALAAANSVFVYLSIQYGWGAFPTSLFIIALVVAVAGIVEESR